ncbi:protein E5B [Elephant endotheliotropic herpesvirus 5B]|nr:protein E5B [Elephant endotheliotropic herpesvirus 5B]
MGFGCFITPRGGGILYLLLGIFYNGIESTFNVESIQNVNITLRAPEYDRYRKYTWIYGTDQKIAEMDEDNKTEYFNFINRSYIDMSGSLHIYNLQQSDAGSYELQVWDKNGYENNYKFMLDIRNTSIFGGPLFLNLSCDTSKLQHNYLTSNMWTEDYGFIEYNIENAGTKIVYKRSKYTSHTCHGTNTIGTKTIDATISCTSTQTQESLKANGNYLCSFYIFLFIPLYIT